MSQAARGDAGLSTRLEDLAGARFEGYAGGGGIRVLDSDSSDLLAIPGSDLPVGHFHYRRTGRSLT